MQLSIDLKTASLKDAEHAIFIIGAYFGMTNLPTAPAAPVAPLPAIVLPAAPAPVAVAAPAPVVVEPLTAPVQFAPAPVEQSAAAVFGGAQDAAAVFGAGNVAGVPAPSTVAVDQSHNVQTALAAGVPTPPPAALPHAVPTAPSVAAPTANAAPTNPAPGVDVDAEGLPWDARIHASTKTKLVNGNWKAKKGINDPALVERVRAELRATMAIPAPVAAAPAPAAPVPTPTPVAAAPAPFVPPVAPSPHVAPVAPSKPADPVNFEQLMPRVTQAMHAGHLPADALQNAVTAYQLPNIPALAARPDMVPYVWAYMRESYPAFNAAVS